MNRWLSLIGFLVLTVGGGLAIGIVTAPGEWYAALAKPAFNPPNWIFAPVWTVLYVLIAVAGWRAAGDGRNGWSIRLWWPQLGFNFAWSPIFFSAHQIDAALGSFCCCWRASSRSSLCPGGKIVLLHGFSYPMRPGWLSPPRSMPPSGS